MIFDYSNCLRSFMPVTVDVVDSKTLAQSSDPVQQLLQTGIAYIASSALWIIAELNIADMLGDGPQPVSKLAALAGVNEDALYRCLRALTMAGIFAEPELGRFALLPPGERLRTDRPDSQRDSISWLADPFHFKVFENLLYSVKTGEPSIEAVTGKPLFEYLSTDPVESTRFNAAMSGISSFIMPAILEAYDFSPFKTIVDVAGGHGFVICEILRKHPRVKGVLFDLEHVVGGAVHRICELALEGRCRAVAGDFFKSVPEGGDAYLMKCIIHDWDDEKSATILRNCRTAMQGNRQAKVILLEQVVPGPGQPHFSKLLDLVMLTFPGGRERTAEEFKGLFAKAGFRLTRIVPTESPLSVIEAEVA